MCAYEAAGSTLSRLQGAPPPDCNRNPPLNWGLFWLIFEPMDSCFRVLPSRRYPGVLPGPIHLGPQRAHGSSPPTPRAIVSRTAFAVSWASGLIKTPKGSNPWMLLKDLQLLPFMKKAGCGGGGECRGAGRAGERRIWTRASYPNRAPVKTDRVVFYQLKLPCLLSRSISPFNSH